MAPSGQAPLQDPCNQPAGTCLGGQLGSLLAGDQARAAGGTTPLYLVDRWSGGLPGALQACALC